MEKNARSKRKKKHTRRCLGRALSQWHRAANLKWQNRAKRRRRKERAKGV
jgi:hypothetical protein